MIRNKVIIKKSRGEVEQDTIEKVPWPMKNLKCFSKISNIFDTSKCATNYVFSFDVCDGFIGQQILKL